jgi:transposase InsO family protein
MDMGFDPYLETNAGQGLAPTSTAQRGIHHTDCGAQYGSHDGQKCLMKHGFDAALSCMKTSAAAL